MKVIDVVQKLEAKVLSGNNGLNKEVTGGYCSDLLSDVMGFAQEGQIWITIQSHKNIMAVASLKDISVIILPKNITAEEDTLAVSNKENIPILSSEMDVFTIAGIVYNLLNQ